jgi:hypothetical protein
LDFPQVSLFKTAKHWDSFFSNYRCKHASCALNISSGAAPPTLSLRNLFETLLVNKSLDNEKDENFQSVSGSGSKSSDNSGDDSTGLELISNNEV